MKENKQMDEMERHILLRSQAYGYQAAVLALALLVLYKSALALVRNTAPDMMLLVLMWIPQGVQWISQAVMKRKMTEGDEEYREPNTIVRAVVTGVVLAAFIAALGAFVILEVTR